MFATLSSIGPQLIETQGIRSHGAYVCDHRLSRQDLVLVGDTSDSTVLTCHRVNVEECPRIPTRYIERKGQKVS